MRQIILATLAATALFSGIAHADVARRNGADQPGAHRVMMGDATPSRSKAPASIDHRGTDAQG